MLWDGIGASRKTPELPAYLLAPPAFGERCHGRLAPAAVIRGYRRRLGKPSSAQIADDGLFPRSLRSHRHHVAVEIGDDPDGAGNDEKDDQYAEGKSQNIVRAIGAAAQMQEEHEVDADLREREYDQSDGYARGPEQIGLRHDEGGDRRQDRKHQTHRVRQVAGRWLMLFDTRRPVVEQTIASS